MKKLRNTQTKLRNAQTGFSLIELMIVIGIIGMMAVAALPAYQNYVARAQVAEGIMLAGSMKSYVEEAYTDKGSLPLDLNIKQLASDDNKVGNYVKIVRIEDNGTIVAAIGNQAAAPVKNTEIHLTPSFAKTGATKDTTVWSCGGTMDTHFLPVSCKQSL